MAAEELQVTCLREDFNKDGFRKILFILGVFILVIILLVATSIYLWLDKPVPVKFATDKEWRIVKPAPLDQPYLVPSDLIQWVSSTVPGLFNYDFINYKNELQKNEHYFTENGWKKFLAFLNSFAAEAVIQKAKLFMNGNAEGAPFILNQGLLEGRYSWWVQMPVTINYSSGYSQTLNLQVLIVRVSTLNNLYGVAIDNMLVPAGGKGVGSKVIS